MKLHELQIIVNIKVTVGWEWLLATIMDLPDRVNRGWKPLPQSNSLIFISLYFLGSEEVPCSLKLAVFQANGGADF